MSTLEIDTAIFSPGSPNNSKMLSQKHKSDYTDGLSKHEILERTLVGTQYEWLLPSDVGSMCSGLHTGESGDSNSSDSCGAK